MFVWAYCIISFSLCKIIIDILNPELFATFSVIIDNLLFFIILSLIVNVVIKQKTGKREELKDTLAELEKNISQVENQ